MCDKPTFARNAKLKRAQKFGIGQSIFNRVLLFLKIYGIGPILILAKVDISGTVQDQVTVSLMFFSFIKIKIIHDHLLFLKSIIKLMN